MYEYDSFKHYYSGSLISLCPYEFMIELGPLITNFRLRSPSSVWHPLTYYD